MADEVWYYHRDGEQHGPVTFDQLRELAAEGQLGPDDLVWEQSMSDWVAARSVEGLIAGQVPPPIPPRLPAREPLGARGKALLRGAAERTRKLHEAEGAVEALPHLRVVDYLLTGLRNTISQRWLDGVDRAAKQVGHVAYVVAALLVLVLFLIGGIRSGSFQQVLQGFVVVLGAWLGHYVAVLFLDAGTTLLRKAPSELASSAFLSSFGLLAFVGALLCLVFGAYQLAQPGGLPTFGWMIGGCLVLLYAGGAALNPATVNVTVGEEAGPGKEAIGILMFLLKLPLRLVAFLFGVGTVVGVVAVVYFIIRALTDQGLPYAGMMAKPLAGGVLGLALVPFAVYVAFLLLYLEVEVLRAILVIPGKLEVLGKKR